MKYLQVLAILTFLIPSLVFAEFSNIKKDTVLSSIECYTTITNMKTGRILNLKMDKLSIICDKTKNGKTVCRLFSGDDKKPYAHLPGIGASEQNNIFISLSDNLGMIFMNGTSNVAYIELSSNIPEKSIIGKKICSAIWHFVPLTE